MVRSVSIMVGLFGGLVVAGCTGGKLQAKVDRLERELADQRAMTKRLEGRLDELQIQVTLLNRQLRAGPAKTGQAAPAGDMPAMPVVRLQDRPAKRSEPKARPRPRRRKPWKLTTAKFEDIDPAEVTERLQVDKAAARRPLPAAAAPGSADDPRVAAEDAEVAAEEASVTRSFQDAFGLYRINELDRASRALAAFAKSHGDHPRAPDALFYAGKSLMMLDQNDRAAKTFLELVRAYPGADRSAEALLLAGRCQEKLGRAKEARGTYLQLVDAYPLSEQAGKANKRLQSIR